MSLSCILDAFLEDTPLDHIFFHICPYAHMGIFGQICPYGHMGIWAYVKKWSSGVSPKRASKMQLRNVDLRSVGPSVQKLWPTTFFARKMPCILHCNEKKIRISTSRLDRGLVQKAKWSEIFRRSRIQAVPTISNNLCPKCLGLLSNVQVNRA